VQEGIANVLGQRETGLAPAFTGHNKRCFLPMDIGETQSDDIAAPKPSTSHQQDDGLIASA
jgi:hypothetical protein